MVFASAHIHSNGRDTKARLLYGFKFFPKGYQPEVQIRAIENWAMASTSTSGRKKPTSGWTLTRYWSSPPKSRRSNPTCTPLGRACVWNPSGASTSRRSPVPGTTTTGCAFTNTSDDYAPLLPKGTILHIIGYMDNTPANRNVPDPRNWSGSGNRSISNMFIDLGQQAGAYGRTVLRGDGATAREAEAYSQRGSHRMPALQRRSHYAAAAEDWGHGRRRPVANIEAGGLC